MKKHVLLGLLMAAVLLGLIGVVAGLGGQHGAGGDSRHVAEPRECPADSCG